MGRIAKPKKKSTSIHSRAARRETSPSLNTDASLKTIKPPSSRSFSSSLTQNSGITKKKKQKQLTRQQKLRQQKVMERADSFTDRLEKKRTESATRMKKGRERRMGWDDMNQKIESQPAKRSTGEEEYETMDEEEEEEASLQEETHALSVLPQHIEKHLPSAAQIQPESVPLPALDEDEIL